MYWLYSALTVVFLLLASPYLLYQAIRYKKYLGSIGQRMGYLPVTFNLDGDESIWIHAVSVGEVLTARALLPELKERYPHFRIFLSTTTLAGQQLARRQIRAVDAVFYFPFDWAFIVRRTLDLVKPRLFIMVETEIWPNVLRACKARGVGTVLVSGRLSARSHSRYRLVRPFFRHVLNDIDRFCVQSDDAARRLIGLGADPSRVTVTGSLKFESFDNPAVRRRDRAMRYFHVSQGRPVIVAGSTMRGEERVVLDAYARISRHLNNPLLILAPRHPERFAEVEALSNEQGFHTVRRSELPVDSEPRAEVVILDTIGELAQLYQVATVVFVGGSLVETGGHNIIEPAVFGKPIVFGPHMYNFAEIAESFLASGAAVQMASDRDLEGTLTALLNDPARRAGLGAAARAIIEANHGARDKTLAVIAQVLPTGSTHSGVIRPFRVVH
jgi:3-deoxy-D-manno-octulosonic-acid transferase